jgi:glycosyltransferase involved in cell wall biosynthesis
MQCLDNKYSTTRRVTREKPKANKSQAEENSLLLLPDGVGRHGEGGLRTEGYFKASSSDAPLITVITVVFNGASFLEETILSVIHQSYENVEYIVIDGGSIDDSVSIIQNHEHAIDYWVSESDGGMYEALVKGFSVASGEVVCYINAGDLFYPKAFEVVADNFSGNDIEWLTGLRSVCNENNIITRVETPFRYKAKLIERGVYGKWLPYLQQESTFWKRDLLKYVDFDVLSSLKLAGDYYLWCCFSKKTSVEVINSPLGIFKKHKGQLTESIEGYWSEVNEFVLNKNLLTIMDVCYEAFFWMLDASVRGKLVQNMWCFNSKQDKWICGADRRNL